MSLAWLLARLTSLPAAGTAKQRGGCQKGSFKSIPNVAALVLQVGSGALLGTAGFSAVPLLGRVQDESAQAGSGACSPQAGTHESHPREC